VAVNARDRSKARARSAARTCSFSRSEALSNRHSPDSWTVWRDFPSHRHQHVAGVELRKQSTELRPVGLCPARHFREDGCRAGGPKLAHLGVELCLSVDTRA
jgi:hypothetical protein